MKNIFKTIMILLVLIGSTTSCTESDKAVDTLLNEVDTSGAVLRTKIYPLELVNLTNDDINQIEMTFEVQEANGDIEPDFKEVRVYYRVFVDQDLLIPLSDGDGVAFDEFFAMTLPASDFTPSEDNGLPSYDLYIETQTIYDQFPGGVYSVPSFIELRLELEMTDGRIVSKDDVSADVAGGAYFEAPFSYRIIFLPF